MKFPAFISGPPPDGFVEQALCRGTKYLCLMTHANPEAIPNFPKSNQLEYLDINSSNIEEEYFRQLILSCHKLTKLSVYYLIGQWKSADLVKGILQNALTLKVLDISKDKYEKLVPKQIKDIVKACVNLTEANFGEIHRGEEWTSFVCENLTTKIRKLRLDKDFGFHFLSLLTSRILMRIFTK